MSLKTGLEWRYATKKFDNTKKIPADKLEHLLQTVKLAPSSFGLQHYEIVVVEDPAVRERLKEASYGQSQLTDASQVIVFAVETNIDEDYVKAYIDEMASVRGVKREDLSGFEQYVLGSVSRLSREENINWAKKQAYIALGVLISSASELQIDSCPMEGFEADKYDEILGLKEKGLTATVMATIGYRSDEDLYANMAKVRKSDKDLFIRI